MTDPIEPVTNDKIYGMMAALQVSLRALTKSHEKRNPSCCFNGCPLARA